MLQELLKTIEKNISSSIEQYIQRIVEQYPDIDKNALYSLWNENSCDILSPTISSRATSSRISSSELTCVYVPSKGKNAGSRCTKKPVGGRLCCSLHKKYENKQTTEKKILPESKRNVSTKSTSKSPNSKSPPSKEVQRVFRKHRTLDKLYHPETNLVIKSAQQRVIVGKIVDDKLVDIDDDDIEVCKIWGFQYEENSNKKEVDIHSDKESKNSENKELDSTLKDVVSSQTKKPENKIDSDSESDIPTIKKPQPKKPENKIDSDSESDIPTIKKPETKKPQTKKVETKKPENKIDSDSESDIPTIKKPETKKPENKIDSESESDIPPSRNTKKVNHLEDSSDEDTLGFRNKNKKQLFKRSKKVEDSDSEEEKPILKKFSPKKKTKQLKSSDNSESESPSAKILKKSIPSDTEDLMNDIDEDIPDKIMKKALGLRNSSIQKEEVEVEEELEDDF